MVWGRVDDREGPQLELDEPCGPGPGTVQVLRDDDGAVLAQHVPQIVFGDVKGKISQV